MEISLMQGILIGLVTAFCYSGMLLGIYTNRAIVMAFFVGLILGDIPTALTFGALAELAYMGFGVGAGGTVPPNPVGPGIVGTIMVITLKDQGITPENALALSFPFAVLFQFVTTFLYTFFAGNPKMAEKAIENGHFGKFKLIAHSTYIGLAVAGFINVEERINSIRNPRLYLRGLLRITNNGCSISWFSICINCLLPKF